MFPYNEDRSAKACHFHRERLGSQEFRWPPLQPHKFQEYIYIGFTKFTGRILQQPRAGTQAIKSQVFRVSQMNVQPAGLELFAERGPRPSQTGAWQSTSGHPEIIPSTPRVLQPHTFEGLSPGFALPDLDDPHATPVHASQQMRCGGSALVGLGLIGLDDATRAAFADMRNIAKTSELDAADCSLSSS